MAAYWPLHHYRACARPFPLMPRSTPPSPSSPTRSAPSVRSARIIRRAPTASRSCTRRWRASSIRRAYLGDISADRAIKRAEQLAFCPLRLERPSLTPTIAAPGGLPPLWSCRRYERPYRRRIRDGEHWIRDPPVPSKDASLPLWATEATAVATAAAAASVAAAATAAATAIATAAATAVVAAAQQQRDGPQQHLAVAVPPGRQQRLRAWPSCRRGAT